MLGYRIPSDYKNDVSKYTHNWKHPAFFTMHPGLAYVTHHRHLNAGDRVRGTVGQLVQSQPMAGPLMQGFQMVTIATFTPDGVIYGWQRNGIKYSPEEWTKFDKWYLNPVSPIVVTQDKLASSPGGYNYFEADGVTIQQSSYFLNPGICAYFTNSESISSQTAAAFYDVWNTPYYIFQDSPESESLGFYQNAFCAVGRGGLADCLGMAPGTTPPLLGSSATTIDVPSLYMNVAPFAAYFLSTYYYLANMQEPYMYFSRGAYTISRSVPGFGVGNSGTAARLSCLNFNAVFSSLDPNEFIKEFSYLAYQTQSGNASQFDVGAVLPAQFENSPVIGWMLAGLQAHGGLFSVPYRPDFFNNIIKIGDSPTVNIPVTEVSGEGGTFQLAVPDLRYYTKWQNVMDRLFVGAGRFGDQLRTLLGTNSSPYTNKPDLLGVWMASMDPINTVALAAGENSASESSATGQMFARMDAFSDFRNKSLDYYAKEPGTLMFISFIVPKPCYSQGMHPDLSVLTFADEFNPEMKGLGFTSVPRSRYTTLPNSFSYGGNFVNVLTQVDPNTLSVGDTVVWDWLKTDYPRLHGEFATGGYFEYWNLRRSYSSYYYYELSNGVRNVSVDEYFGTYINPLAWQYVFQAQSLLDPNFFVGFNFNLRVTSAVPAGYMPYLGR